MEPDSRVGRSGVTPPPPAPAPRPRRGRRRSQQPDPGSRAAARAGAGARTRAGFVLDRRTGIDAAPGTEGTERWLRSTVGAAFGLALPPVPAGRDDTVVLRLDPRLGAEAYRLDAAAASRRVRITGGDPAGVFWGADPPAAPRRRRLPAGARPARRPRRPAVLTAPTVEDRPRFGWRGLLLDVARHFLPKDDVLRYVDLLAAHKLNVLHLHLTDDQGWRIEIRRYPR